MAETKNERREPVTDSPWFWVMLFSLAALAGVFTIGPKFERREAAIEAKFHARERGLGREAYEKVADDDSQTPMPAEPQWRPIFTLTALVAVLAVVALVAMFNVLRFQQRRLAALATAHETLPAEPISQTSKHSDT